MRFALPLLSIALGALSPVQAQERPASDWSVSVGAAVLATPRFEGSDRMRVLPVPFVDIRYRDLLFASFRDGIGANLLSREVLGEGGVAGLSAGPILRWRFGRDEDADPILRGLGDVDVAGEAGAFVAYTFAGMARVRVEARRGFGGHEGLILDGAFDVFGRFGDLTVSVGPTLSWSDARFNDTYFGITPAQARASGLPAYAPGAGLRSVGVSSALAWRMTDTMSLALFGNWSRLGSVATDSPIVRRAGSDDQITAGAALTWRLSQ